MSLAMHSSIMLDTFYVQKAARVASIPVVHSSFIAFT